MGWEPAVVRRARTGTRLYAVRMELLTALGLSSAAGLNAYIPMLALGLLARFTDLVHLPQGWTWLSSPWTLGIVGILLVVEIVADKVPVLDTINDTIQSVVRPAAGGIVFSTGAGAQTVTVDNPDAFFGSQQWIPVAIGAAIALAIHLVKMATRPALNAASAGVAAPVVSTAEDAASVSLAAAALFLPVLVLVLIAALVGGFALLARRVARRVRGARRREVV